MLLGLEYIDIDGEWTRLGAIELLQAEPPPRRTAGRGIAGAIARLLRRKKRRRIQVASAQEIAAWNRHRQQLDHDDPGGYGHLW